MMTRATLVRRKYSEEKVRQMMIKMYEMTGSDKQEEVYDAINAMLNLLIGHHLLFTGRERIDLELSDSEFEPTNLFRIDRLFCGFQYNHGKALKNDRLRPIRGVIRHKYVELCLATAYAMSLWYRFDFLGQDAPHVGVNKEILKEKKSWYPLKVLFNRDPGATSGSEISRNYQMELMKTCLDSIGYTNFGFFGEEAKARDEDVASIEKAQVIYAGSWANEVINNRIIWTYPPEYMHISAGFTINEPYFIPREIKPPKSLRRKIFPWLEEIQEATENLRSRTEDHDGVIHAFLIMLDVFRYTILQDLAVLVDIAPESIFCKHPITKDPLFIRFKAKINGVSVDLSEDISEASSEDEGE